MRVLVAVQNSECVERLSDFILGYPWPAGSHFKIIHVVQPVQVNSYMSFLPSALTSTIAEERWHRGRKLVRDLALKLRDAWKTANIEEAVVEGEAKMEVVELADEWQADLILMGSHGKTGLQTLGSVSKAICTQCSCSVMVVPIPAKKKARS